MELREKIARALCGATHPMEVAAGDVRDIPILNLDPDFDDIASDDRGTSETCPFHEGHVLALADAILALPEIREALQGCLCGEQAIYCYGCAQEAYTPYD